MQKKANILPNINFKKILITIAINIIILVVLWLLFFKLLRKIYIVDYIYEQGIYYFTKIQLISSKVILNLLGYSVEIYGKTIKIVQSNGVLLDRGCLGRNTIGLLIGFILALPGKLKNKIWYSAMGLVIFIILNVLRITALAITQYCCPERLDFNHHFLFKIIVYVIILILWIIWINKYSEIKSKSEN